MVGILRDIHLKRWQISFGHNQSISRRRDRSADKRVSMVKWVLSKRSGGVGCAE